MNPSHVNWFDELDQKLATADSKEVSIIKFIYEQNDQVLSEWAEHFRNHYCSIQDLDALRAGTGKTSFEVFREKLSSVA